MREEEGGAVSTRLERKGGEREESKLNIKLHFAIGGSRRRRRRGRRERERTDRRKIPVAVKRGLSAGISHFSSIKLAREIR